MRPVPNRRVERWRVGKGRYWSDVRAGNNGAFKFSYNSRVLHVIVSDGAGPHIAIMARIEWPWFKPPAHVTIDDRALTFVGTWPELQAIHDFKPWNKT